MNIKSNFIKIIILSLLIIGNVFTIKVNASESTSTPATNIQTNLTTDTPKIEIKTQPAAIQNSKKSSRKSLTKNNIKFIIRNGGKK